MREAGWIILVRWVLYLALLVISNLQVKVMFTIALVKEDTKDRTII